MDFNDYSSVTTDPLPPIGSHQEMRFYWDSSHFKEIVGDYILDRLFAVSTADPPAPFDFGVILNTKTLDAVLARVRQSRAEYRKESPQDIAELQSLLPELPIVATPR